MRYLTRMIQKSVSGSTRLVALAALLLIPAWGLAEEPDCVDGVCKYETTERLCVDTGDGKCTDWWEYLKGHQVTSTKIVKLSCYQRMREAMQLAAKHKFWPMFDVQMDYNIIEGSLYTPNCDEVCKAQKQLDEAKAKKKQRDDELKAKATWNQTMKDCVEGQ